MEQQVRNLQDLLDRIDAAADGVERVSLGHVLETVGRRSFGPLLLFAGLVVISPLSAIPGVPTLMAVLVFAVAVQLLFHRTHFWLPAWLLERELPHDKLRTTLKWSRPPARWIDRVLRVRLAFFTRRLGVYLIAVICLVVAVGMPPMELVPFSVTVAGMTLALLGLALIAHDGLIALIGILFAVFAYGFLVSKLLPG